MYLISSPEIIFFFRPSAVQANFCLYRSLHIFAASSLVILAYVEVSWRWVKASRMYVHISMTRGPQFLSVFATSQGSWFLSHSRRFSGMGGGWILQISSWTCHLFHERNCRFSCPPPVAFRQERGAILILHIVLGGRCQWGCLQRILSSGNLSWNYLEIPLSQQHLKWMVW